MPELPEVETIVRGLNKTCLRKKIKKVLVSCPVIVRPKNELLAITGDNITNIARHGKYIKITTKKGMRLIVHLRMTGQLFLAKNYKPDKHVHIIIEFASMPEKLYYRDIRKFGRWVIVPPQKEFSDYINAGQDALVITQKEFDVLAKKYGAKALKVFLLDQTILAGVGNIYADETAFILGINPHTPVKKINSQKLLSTISTVLKLGIKNKGTSVSDYITSTGAKGNFQNLLKVYRQKNCHKCGTAIKRVKLAGRTTHICPRCQK